MAQYCREQCGLLDTEQEDTVLHNIVRTHPAIDIEGAARTNDTLSLKFFKEVLLTVRVLIVTSVEQLKWIMPCMKYDIELLSETIQTGEIYARLVHAMCSKDITHNEVSLVSTLSKLGKLALKFLLSGNPFLKKT